MPWKVLRALLFLPILLLGACSGKPQADEVLYSSYKVGMSRAEVHTLLAGYMQIASLDRPAAGWEEVSDGERGAVLYARNYEKEHPGSTAASVEAYWVPRATSAPSVPMALGVYYDYFLFDEGGRVLDFRRRFVD